MTIVHVVTDGEYSDYRIQGVFSAAEKAQAYIDSAYGREFLRFAEIEEWELDDPELESSHYQVCISQTGEVLSAILLSGASQGFIRWSDNSWRAKEATPYLVWDVITDDRQRAIKVTNEARVKILEWNLWGNPMLDTGKVLEMIEGNQEEFGVSPLQETGE